MNPLVLSIYALCKIKMPDSRSSLCVCVYVCVYVCVFDMVWYGIVAEEFDTFNTAFTHHFQR